MSEFTDTLDDVFAEIEAATNNMHPMMLPDKYIPQQDSEAAMNAEAWKWKRSGKGNKKRFN